MRGNIFCPHATVDSSASVFHPNSIRIRNIHASTLCPVDRALACNFRQQFFFPSCRRTATYYFFPYLTAALLRKGYIYLYTYARRTVQLCSLTSFRRGAQAQNILVVVPQIICEELSACNMLSCPYRCTSSKK